MCKTAFTEEQIADTLRQAEAGTAVGEICRKLEISQQTFYRWKNNFAGMGVAGDISSDENGSSRHHFRSSTE